MNNRKLNNQEYPAANREYKDRLFRFVFQKKEDLLSLYNAVNEKYIAEKDVDIYTSTRKVLPFPQYFVFYNGTKEEPERMQLKLSDMFDRVSADHSSDRAGRKVPCLECIATMLNINYGHNQELMEKCRRLKEYAYFVDTVRRNFMVEMPLRAAVMQAIDECIEKGIMEDILVPQKAEVVQMILETFDQEKHDEAMKRDWYEVGRADGEKIGIEKGQAIERENSIRRLISSLREAGVQEEKIGSILQKEYTLTCGEAEKYLKECQK